MADSDLLHHYKVLKQFLDISDDSNSRAKSSSSRAARAREKLLKLSGAQFRELSTDVFDELKRRIDESRTEPDFLLPKLTFHPKRNQARQKLSSLPQSRFKDLVSDISYEIERRNLHVSVATSSPAKPKQDANQYRAAPTTDHTQEELHNDASYVANSTPSDELSTPDLAREQVQTRDVPKQTIGIQPTTVIPTKANLAWSSDEEDEGDTSNIIGPHTPGSFTSNGVRAVGETPHSTASVATSLAFEKEVGELQRTLSALRKDNAALKEQNAELQLTHETMKGKIVDLEHRNQDLDASYQTLEQTHLSNKSTLELQLQNVSNERDLHLAKSADLPTAAAFASLQNDYEELKKSSAQLRLENQALKNGEGKRMSRLLSGHMANDASFSGNSRRESFNSELKKFYEKMDLISSPKSSPKASSREEQLRSEAAKWQKRYEAAQAGNFASTIQAPSTNAKDLQKYVSPQGLIPLSSASNFFASIDSFLISINDANPDSELLFDKISKIAVAANKIATLGDKHILSSNDYSVSVREAVSHALTATRYYASHSKVLPKVVVERAVGEVAFTMCDLISISKLGDGLLTDKDLSNISTSHITDDSNDGVRPLRMTNKLQPITNLDSYNGRSLSSPLSKSAAGLPQSRNPLKIESNFVNGQSLPIDVNFVSTAKSQESQQREVPKLDQPKQVPQQVENGQEPAQVRKLSLFERLLNAKVMKDDSTAKDVDATEPAAQKAPQLNGSGLSKLDPSASKVFETSNEQNHVKQQQASPRGASAKSIMDKVKHFESPPREPTAKKGPQVTSPSVSVQSTKALFTEGSAADSDQTSPLRLKDAQTATSSSAIDTSNVPTRGRSIFQSLRDRFATDGTTNGDKDNTSEDSVNADDFPVSAPNAFKDASSTMEKRFSANEDDLDELSTQIGQDELPLHIKKVSSTTARFVGPGSPEQLVYKPAVTTSDSAPTTRSIATPSTFKPVDDKSAPSTAPKSMPMKSPSFKVKKVNYAAQPEVEDEEEDDDYDEEEEEARQRQEYRKSMAAATFNFDLFDIDDPDNTLTQVLLYLEHQTVQVISTIQDLLSAIKKPDATRGDLRENSGAISEVIRQMTEATNTSMNQTRNYQLKEHGSWVVKSLEDCNHRMNALCRPNAEKDDLEFADKNFKQRLAGISFDIAKCTKELVKTVEEASLKEDIAQLDARLQRADDLR